MNKAKGYITPLIICSILAYLIYLGLYESAKLNKAPEPPEKGYILHEFEDETE